MNKDKFVRIHNGPAELLEPVFVNKCDCFLDLVCFRVPPECHRDCESNLIFHGPGMFRFHACGEDGTLLQNECAVEQVARITTYCL